MSGQRSHPQGHRTTFSHRIWQQVFHFFLQFSWTTAKGKLCDGTNTADGRNGTNWKREGGRSLDLPFLALFTVHARGAVAAARWRRRSPGRSRKQSGERNKLSRSIDCSALCLLCLLPFRSLVARSSRGSLLYKSYGFSVKLSCFWRSPSSLSLSLEQSPIYTTATASERASDSAQFSGFYAPEPSKEASVAASDDATAATASERAMKKF